MNGWIDLSALWKIIVIGLLAGAGLPALFAIGLRALDGPETEATASGNALVSAQTRPLGLAIAVVCFAIVLAAIGWGVYSVVNG